MSTAMSVLPEKRALLCCARVDLDPGAREELIALLRAGLDVAALEREATYHRLLPLVCRHLHAVAPELCPPDFLKRLAEITQQSVMLSLSLASELVAVLEALRGAGVPAIAIKGPISAALCFDDFGLRTFLDLDILVEPANVARSREVLETRGYALQFPLTPAWQERYVRVGSEQLFRHADGSRLVDLHWCLLPRGYTFTPNGEGVFARRTTVRIGTTEVPTLAVEPTLLFLLLHGMKHDWECLGWLCDVAELLRRQHELDWEAVLDWSAPLGRRRFVDVGLALAHSLLGAPVPPEILHRGEADADVTRIVAELTQRLSTPPRSDAPSLIERSLGSPFFRAMQRPRDRLHFLQDILQPTVLEWDAVPLPPALASLHYLVRPVRLVWKHAVPGWLKGCRP